MVLRERRTCPMLRFTFWGISGHPIDDPLAPLTMAAR
jgi:hypothetical protein